MPYVEGNAAATSVNITIPESQASDNLVMPAFGSATVAADGVVPIKLSNLGSIVAFKLYSATGAYSNEKVSSVKITTTSALAGTFTKDITASSSLEISGYDKTDVTVTVNGELKAASSKENATVVYAVIAPGTYEGNIVVTTDAATYTYPFTNQTFQRSHSKGLVLNFEKEGVREGGESGSNGYVRVTSISDITAGQYIIAAKVGENYYAMTKTFGAKIEPSKVIVSDDKISTTDGDSYSMTFAANGENGWSISNGSLYLGYKSSTDLTGSDTSYKWGIVAGTKGTFRLNSQTSGRACIYRAGETNKFGGYSSTNVTSSGTEYYDIELFKYVGAAVDVTGVTVTPPTASIEVGTTITLTATVAPEDASDKSITWESDNTEVATVDDAGLVTAVSAGTANITVTTADGGHTATCEVTVYSQVINEVSITEFLDAEVGGTEWYKLTGEITNIEDDKNGNFTLKDASGSIYVYGLAIEKGGKRTAFTDNSIALGDIITIIGKRGEYQNNPQVNSAYYVSHTPAPSISLNPTTLNFVAAGESKEVVVAAQNFAGDVTITASSSSSQFTTSVSGTTVTITAAENQSTSDVNGTITITATDGSSTKSAEVSLTQYGNVPFEDAVDEIDRAFTGVSSGSTTYLDWKDKQSSSSARYAGNSAGNYNSIQLRGEKSSGIVSTAPGGYITKVTIAWNSNTTSGRTIQVYGSNSAYSSASDLYGDDKGTLLGTIVYGTSTELTISGEYQYIGIRSASGAMYIDKISITWSAAAPEPSVLTGLTWTGYKSSYTVGDTFEIDGTIKAVYDNGSEVALNADDVKLTVSPDLTVAGTTSATISYTEGTVTKTADATITVNAKTDDPTYAFEVIDQSLVTYASKNGYCSTTASTTYGSWSGKTNYNTSGYIQINKNNNNYYFGATYTKNVVSITIETTNSTTANRTFYICSSNSTAQPTNGDLGSASTTEANGSVKISLPANTKTFYIYANGVAYMKKITVEYEN